MYEYCQPKLSLCVSCRVAGAARAERHLAIEQKVHLGVNAPGRPMVTGIGIAAVGKGCSGQPYVSTCETLEYRIPLGGNRHARSIACDLGAIDRLCNPVLAALVVLQRIQVTQ
jgi:hypothetical protein